MAIQNQKTKRNSEQFTRVKYRTVRRIVYVFYKAMRKLRTIQKSKPNQRKAKATIKIAFLFSFSLLLNISFYYELNYIYLHNLVRGVDCCVKAGQTLVASDGHEVCLFPMDVLYITQLSGPSSLSHCCGNPIDIVGNTPQYPLYAPFSCHLVWSWPDGNERSYTSDNPVWYATPNGNGWTLGYVTVCFTHQNNPPTKTNFKQGEVIAHTGTAGNVTGDHCHLDQSTLPNVGNVSYGVTCAYGNLCYALDGSTDPTKIYFINDTNVVQTLGLNFSTWDGGVTPPQPQPESKKYIPLLLDGMGIEIFMQPIKEEEPTPPEPEPPTGEWIIPGTINETRPLNEEEALNNCKVFWEYFKAKGWSLNAVCGILGNAWYESTVNPNRWQGDDPWHQPPDQWGFGLVQWTPYTKIISWLEERVGLNDVSKFGQAECDRIQWEMENNQQWIATSAYPESFREYSTTTKDPYTCAIEFLANYERPFDPNQPERGTKAQELYDYLLQFE